MFLFSLIKWRKGNAVGKDPTLMVSLERGSATCVRTTRFSWDTPSHVPNPQENPQVQEVSLEVARTSIDSLEAHPHMFPTIKRTHKCKKCHLAKDLDLRSFGESMSTSMSLWVLFWEYHSRARVWPPPPVLFKNSMYHGFLREDHARVWVHLRCFEIHPHAFLNLKRTHDFGKPPCTRGFS